MLFYLKKRIRKPLLEIFLLSLNANFISLFFEFVVSEQKYTIKERSLYTVRTALWCTICRVSNTIYRIEWMYSGDQENPSSLKTM